jgi:peptidoglycan/LPS O-acetylase OafA/YrhL
MQRIVELDGIRGFSALAILLFHYAYLITRQSPPAYAVRWFADYLI